MDLIVQETLHAFHGTLLSLLGSSQANHNAANQLDPASPDYLEDDVAFRHRDQCRQFKTRLGCPRINGLETAIRQADTKQNGSGYFALSLVKDDRALDRLTLAALIGQPESVGLAAQNDIAEQLNNANRLSLTFRFSTNKSSLDSKGLRDLYRLISYMSLSENADRGFTFVGFADSVGEYANNARLSQKPRHYGPTTSARPSRRNRTFRHEYPHCQFW